MKRTPLIVMGLFAVTLVLTTARGAPEPTNTSVPPSTPLGIRDQEQARAALHQHRW